MANGGMPEWTKLAIALAGIGSIAYGLQMPEDQLVRWVFILPGIIVLLGALFLMFGYGKYASRLGFRSGKISLTTVVAILIVLAVGWMVFTGGDFSIPEQSIIGQTSTPAQELVALSLPVKFNMLAGGVTFSALSTLENPPSATLSTVTIYKGNVAWESITVTDVNNIVSSQKYTSGESLHLVLTYTVGGNSVYQSADVTVPYVDKETAEIVAPTEHEINVDVGIVPASSVGLTVLDSTGASVTTNLTAGDYTLLVSVTEDKAGFVKAVVPQADGTTKNFVGGIIIQSTAAVIDIPGAQLVYSEAGKYIYYLPVTFNDHQAAFTLKVLGGTSSTVIITAYHNIDLDYVQRLGTINSEAVGVGSLTITTSA